MSNKARYFYLFVLIVSVFFLYSASQINKISINTHYNIFSYKLTGKSATYLNIFANLVPLLILLGVVITIIFYYANLISNDSVRKFLQLLMVFFVIVFFLLLGNAQNLKSPFASDTTTAASTIVTSSSSSTTSSKTSQGVTANNLIPPVMSSSNLTLINLILISIFAILLIYILIRNRKLFKINIKSSKIESKEESVPSYIHDPYKLLIIKEYLKLSKILESLGINPDYSLTPIEFNDETENHLNYNEINRITHFYEYARFSEEKISEEDFKNFKENLDAIYKKLHLTNTE